MKGIPRTSPRAGADSMTEYVKKTYSFATDAYIEEPWIGYVSLAPEWWDRSRIDQGVARMLLHHDYSKPVGEIDRAWFDRGVEPGEEGTPGMYRAEVLHPTDTRVGYIDDYLRLSEGTKLMDSTSVGFFISRLELVELGKTWLEDKFKAAWTQVEFSAVSTPADVLVGIERSLLSRVDGQADPGDYLTLTRGGAGLGFVRRDMVDMAKVAAELRRLHIKQSGQLEAQS